MEEGRKIAYGSKIFKFERDYTLMYFGDIIDSADFYAFKMMYTDNSMRDHFRFLHAPTYCASTYGAPVPGYALVRDFDRTPAVRGAGYDYSTIASWARDHQLPKLVEWDIDTQELVLASTKKEVFIYFTLTEP